MTTHTTTNNPTLRPADERGVTNIGWLNSRHSFSFGRYYDPSNMGYRALRVINDDRIAPGSGFGEHGHDNMEIVTWVLSGALTHGDSLGHMQRLGVGELQAMSAGTGIRHSEFNASKTEPGHFLQIWLEPDRAGHEPRYLQRAFDAEGRHNRWQLLASGHGDAEALPIHQDAELRVANLDAGASLTATVDAQRHGYLHVATGRVTIHGHTLGEGDALTVDGPAVLAIEAADASQVLWFDLA